MDDLRQEISELRALLAREYARREARDYTLREVVDEDGVHPVPSDAEAARRAGFSAAAALLPWYSWRSGCCCGSFCGGYPEHRARRRAGW